MIRVNIEKKKIFLGQNGLKKSDPNFKSFITQRMEFAPKHNQFAILDVCLYLINIHCICNEYVIFVYRK